MTESVCAWPLSEGDPNVVVAVLVLVHRRRGPAVLAAGVRDYLVVQTVVIQAMVIQALVIQALVIQHMVTQPIIATGMKAFRAVAQHDAPEAMVRHNEIGSAADDHGRDPAGARRGHGGDKCLRAAGLGEYGGGAANAKSRVPG